MTIKKVWIERGCVSSGDCVIICPDVFELENQAIVKEDADFEINEDCIIEAAESCPVNVIRFEEE